MSAVSRLRAALLAPVLLTALAALSTTDAAAAGVNLKSVVSTGLAPATLVQRYPGATVTAGPNPYCTAEPASLFYNTQAFDPAAKLTGTSRQLPGDAGYAAANLPAATNLTPATLAGSHSDYCVGFTLTPNAEPWIIRPSGSNNINQRIQTNPAVPYVADAAVLDSTSTSEVNGDDMDRIVIDLPAGYQGAPANVPTCDAATQFGVDLHSPTACPAASQVGDAYVRVINVIRSSIRIQIPIYGSPVYNLSHGANELALLGIVVQPYPGVAPVKFTVRLSLAPDGSGRIRAITEHAPYVDYDGQYVGTAGQEWGQGTGEILASGDPRIGMLEPGAVAQSMYVESVGIRSWGSATDHPSMPADFGELGTSCTATQQADVAVDTVLAEHSALTASSSNLTGCSDLAFEPGIDVSTTERRPGMPTGVNIGVNVAQSTGARATALIQRADVTLPAGLEVGGQTASGTGGLELCSAAAFDAAHPLMPNQCAEGTKVGTVQITSPLINQPLVGDVYLGPQRAIGELPDLFLEVALAGATADDAPRIKLVGHTSADPDTGAISASFTDIPPLRFSRLELTFPAGPHALFVTPPACGSYSGTSYFTPTSGQPAAGRSSSVTVDQQCSVPFTPGIDLTHADTTAGAHSATRVTITRPTAAPWLTHSVIRLPSGFLANVGLVPACPAAQAATGACPASSRIGTVTAYAGAGDQPLRLSGAMYLRDYDPGDVAGVVIVVRAKLGNLDLGDVVVPGHLRLRPTDTGIDYESEIPTRLRGVALWLQRIDVDLDRADFAINPTSCGPLPYSAVLQGTGGATATIDHTASYTGCGRLLFRPTLKASIIGDNRPGGFPGMYVLLTSPEGDSALKTAAVTLPGGIRIALKNTQNPCKRADFDAVRCPASTRIGSVTANVSVTNEPIRGDIFLIDVAGRSLPSLGLNFTGRYTQRVTAYSEVDTDKRVVVTFPTIPDLPLRQLVINVDSSSRSPLELPPGNCAIGTNWDAVFTAQGGQTAKVRTGLQCADPAEVRLSERRGFTLRLFSLGTRKLLYAKAALPAGWRFVPAVAKRRADAFWIRLDGSTSRPRLTDRTVTAYATGKTATSVRIKVSGKALRYVGGGKRKGQLTIPVRLAFTDGAVQTQSVKVTVK